MQLDNVRDWYPEHLHNRPIFLLREYLQYEILRILFESKYATKYTFLGGTCLRIGYGTERFSEDLDFDNVGLTVEEFEETARIISRGLELLGYNVTLKFAYKGAYHCSIKFPALLYHYELSGHKEAKLMIKLDTEKQAFSYERVLIPINRFGVQTELVATPIGLLGSQKVAAILGRKRAKGRDYYDLHWLLQKGARLNYGYLNDRFGVTTETGLRNLVATHIQPLDFDLLAEDVRPFLIDRTDIKAVKNFPEFWQTTKLISADDAPY